MRHRPVGRSFELFAVALCAAIGSLTILRPTVELAFAADVVLAPLVALAMVAWIAWQDIRTFTIPDGPVIGLALLAAALRLADLQALPTGSFLLLPGLADPLLGLLFGGGSLFVIREAYYRRRGVDGIGFGDVKLAAACGLLLGLAGFAYALLAASLAGLLFAAAIRWRNGSAIGRLPFGSFLAPISWCIFVILRYFLPVSL